jgi:hypothetical protein
MVVAVVCVSMQGGQHRGISDRGRVVVRRPRVTAEADTPLTSRSPSDSVHATSVLQDRPTDRAEPSARDARVGAVSSCTPPTRLRGLPASCIVDPDVGVPRLVFMYWGDGWSKSNPRAAKEIHHLAALSWERHNPDWSVVRLSDATLGQWLNTSSIPAFHPGKNVTFQALSDVLRVHLLERYGGVWADATLFCLGPMADWLHVDVAGTGFFGYRYPRGGIMMATWFLAAPVGGGEVIRRWAAKTDAYWSARDVAHTYFWIHELLTKLYKQDPVVRQLFGNPGGENDRRTGEARSKYVTCARHRPPRNQSFLVKCSTQRCGGRCKSVLQGMREWANETRITPM